MSRVRKIDKNQAKSKRNCFLEDASFLAEEYLPIGGARTPEEARNTDNRQIHAIG